MFIRDVAFRAGFTLNPITSSIIIEKNIAYQNATLDPGLEAEKGVLYPTKPWRYILSTLNLGAPNHMG
jgi:hypothetical protein